jgi:hypothetical protein
MSFYCFYLSNNINYVDLNKNYYFYYNSDNDVDYANFDDGDGDGDKIICDTGKKFFFNNKKLKKKHNINNIIFIISDIKKNEIIFNNKQFFFVDDSLTISTNDENLYKFLLFLFSCVDLAIINDYFQIFIDIIFNNKYIYLGNNGDGLMLTNLLNKKDIIYFFLNFKKIDENKIDKKIIDSLISKNDIFTNIEINDEIVEEKFKQNFFKFEKYNYKL